MVNHVRAHAALTSLSSLLSPDGQSAAAYAAERANFVINLAEAAKAFLDGGNQRATVSGAKRAVTQSYHGAAEAAAGATLQGEDLAFVNAEVLAEFDYLESFWGDLKLQREAGNTQLPADRIETFARSLDALFNEIRAHAQKNMMVGWQIGPTETHCAGASSCSWLDGQFHRLQWFLDKGFIPGKPGGKQKCGGYKCGCRWIKQDGQIFNYAG